MYAATADTWSGVSCAPLIGGMGLTLSFGQTSLMFSERDALRAASFGIPLLNRASDAIPGKASQYVLSNRIRTPTLRMCKLESKASEIAFR